MGKVEVYIWQICFKRKILIRSGINVHTKNFMITIIKSIPILDSYLKSPSKKEDYIMMERMNNVEDILMLNPMQEGILYHYIQSPNSEQYFEQISLELTSHLDIELFEKAWNIVIETNETLRTIFRWKKIDRPVQIVLKRLTMKVQPYDFSCLTNLEQLEKINLLKEEDRQNSFNLERGPLIRVKLCKLSEEKYEVILSFHHILFDGWSMGIIIREVLNIYANLKDEISLNIQKKTPYKEYLRWLRSRDLEDEKVFWKEYLQGFDTKTMLPVENNLQGEKHNTQIKFNTYHLELV